jgi:LPXTG-motif cell wall-anchored protein
MSRRPKCSHSLTAALVLLLSTAATGAAFAQETTPPTTTPTSTAETTAPTTITEPPAPIVTAPVPPSSEPEQADDVIPLPDLHVTVELDKPHYASHEPVHATVTIANIGTGVATRARVHDTGLATTQDSWGDWASNGPGARLEPGTSAIIDITAKIAYALDGGFTFSVEAGRELDGFVDANPADNAAVADAEVTVTVGSVTGLVYVDHNHNGTPDQGEALAGSTITVTGGVPFLHVEVTTGQDGRFAFNDLNTGSYYVQYQLPDGWQAYGGPDLFRWTVEPGQSVEMSVEAMRPTSELLTVSMALEKDVYAVGDQVHLAVTLTSRVTWDISGVTAQCDTLRENNLVPTAPGWGVFAPGGPGATVPAGQSVTIPVTDTIRDVAWVYGLVRVTCRFAPGDGYYGRTEATDSARVPGGFGMVKGRAVPGRASYGQAVANTEIVFSDWGTKEFAGRTTTDSDGNFVLGELPAGEYKAAVTGWGPQRVVSVKANTINDLYLSVDRIREAPAPDLTTSPAPGPGGAAPSSGDPQDLAYTGASVIGLSILGLLALLAGAGTMVVSRRRRAT